MSLSELQSTLALFLSFILKWKSQYMTKANTMQASKEFRKGCPLQKLLVVSGLATEDTGTTWAVTIVAEVIAFECCISSSSIAAFTFSAVELHISQTLKNTTTRNLRTDRKLNGYKGTLNGSLCSMEQDVILHHIS